MRRMQVQHRSPRRAEPEPVPPLDPRDPDVLRAKQPKRPEPTPHGTPVR